MACMGVSGCLKIPDTDVSVTVLGSQKLQSVAWVWFWIWVWLWVWLCRLVGRLRGMGLKHCSGFEIVYVERGLLEWVSFCWVFGVL